MEPNRYIDEANSTVPPSLHTRAIPQNVLANGLQAVADAAENLNAVKKLLVYGPDKRPLPEDNPLRSGNYVKDTPTDTGDMPEEVLHGIVGLLTESGELAELALTSIVGRDQPFDRANLREELGDKFWYIARILKRMQQLHPDEDWSFEAIMGENAAKLAVRHKSTPGQSFNPDAGGEEGRDRAAEKAAMEEASKPPQKNYKGEEIKR